MKPPCEIVVKKILPAIRSILVRDLRERHELSQTKIADYLGITQPAVSQYLSSARGSSKVEENLKKTGIYSELKNLSDKIAGGDTKKSKIIKKYCKICNSMGEEEILCIFHTESEPYLSEEECKLCLKTRGRGY